MVLLVGLLGLIGFTVASLLSGNSSPRNPDSEDTTGLPGPGPLPPPAQPTDGPAPPPPPGRPADVGDLAAQVARLHQLALRRALRTRVTSAGALADKVSQIAFEESDPEEVDDTERLLVALRLAPPGTDLDATMERLYREQILGLYVPKERTLYVRKGGGKSPLQRVTTVHEITHALQDQSFDLVAMQRRVRKDAEASLALLSLIEGDAVLTQQLWAQEHLTAAEQQRLTSESGGSSDALDSTPDYLRASLFFPYEQGGRFVVELYRSDGFAAINNAFDDPPATSEQILHPERYLQRDEPVDTPVNARPPADWEAAATFAFGEFDLLEMFKDLGEDSAATAAGGWDGGEIRSWERGDDTVVAAALAFDSDGDAAEACDALGRWYVQIVGGRAVGPDTNGTNFGEYATDADRLVVVCDGAQLRFGLAPTAALARDLAG